MRKNVFLLLFFLMFISLIGCEKEHVHDLTFYEGTEGTCVSEGIKEYYYCSECDTKFSDSEGLNIVTESELIIPTSEYEHELIYQEGIEATCINEGMYEHYYCDTCDKYFLDNEGKTIVIYEEIIIPIDNHKDDNGDLCCDYNCGKAAISKEELQSIIDNTLSLKEVTSRSYYWPGAQYTSVYIEESLMYVNVDGGEEKYIYNENGKDYTLTKLHDSWEKAEIVGEIEYKLAYLFKKFNVVINGEIEICGYSFGAFANRKTLKYKNELDTYVSIIVNNEGTLLEGILIHDEGNNIIYQFEFSFGKNEEVLKIFSSIKSNIQ